MHGKKNLALSSGFCALVHISVPALLPCFAPHSTHLWHYIPKMKLTTAIAAAILAFTASAMPSFEQNSRTPETTSTGLPFDSHPDNLESLPTITNGLSAEDQNDYRGLRPIPLSVAPNGIIAPGPVEPPMSPDSDFPNNLKDFPITTRDETHVKDEINPTRPSLRPDRFRGHGPVVHPPHALDAAQIERRDNSTDQPPRDMYEIYWEEHLNTILDTFCPFRNYFKFGPRLSSACRSWTPPSNISQDQESRDQYSLFSKMDLKAGTKILEPTLIPRGEPSNVLREENKIGEDIKKPFQKIEEPFVEPKDKTESLPQKNIVPRIIGNTGLAPGQGPLKYAYPFNIEIGDVLRSGEAPAESS